MNIKTLLWKDYRQNRKTLIAVGIFLTIPYLIALIVGIVVRSGPAPGTDYNVRLTWSDLLHAGSLWSLAFLVVLCAFFSGNAVAGERADRSAEFAAHLPISRRAAIASKAVLAIGACLLAALVNLLIGYAAGESSFLRSGDQALAVYALGAASTVLVFGVSWLVSALASSAVNAAASGIAALILLWGTFGLVEAFREGRTALTSEWLYVTMCLLLGVGCFVAGVVYYVRRVEP